MRWQRHLDAETLVPPQPPKGHLGGGQAEAVAALVSARTAAAADSALAGLAGGAGAAVAAMRAAALRLLAEIEASIDFEDELPEVRRVVVRMPDVLVRYRTLRARQWRPARY